MIQIKALSGDTAYTEEKLAEYLNAGWEVIDMSTSLYDSTVGMRKETTVYLKKVQSV